MTDAARRGAWLRARNPTVKLAVLLVVSLGLLFLLEPRTLAALALLALLGAWWAAGVPWRALLAAQVPFVLFGLGLVAVNALSRPGTPLLEELPVRASLEGLLVGVALALRAVVIGAMTIAFLRSTPPRELMVSLGQHARLSPRFAYALLAGHRMLAAMPQRWGTIRAAHAVRAPLRRDGTPRLGAVGFARSAFALLVSSIRASERIALALESRGLSARPRSLWRPVPLDGRDAVLAVAVLGSVGAVVAVGVLAGGGAPR